MFTRSQIVTICLIVTVFEFVSPLGYHTNYTQRKKFAEQKQKASSSSSSHNSSGSSKSKYTSSSTVHNFYSGSSSSSNSYQIHYGQTTGPRRPGFAEIGGHSICSQERCACKTVDNDAEHDEAYHSINCVKNLGCYHGEELPRCLSTKVGHGHKCTSTYCMCGVVDYHYDLACKNDEWCQMIDGKSHCGKMLIPVDGVCNEAPCQCYISNNGLVVAPVDCTNGQKCSLFNKLPICIDKVIGLGVKCDMPVCMCEFKDEQAVVIQLPIGSGGICERIQGKIEVVESVIAIDKVCMDDFCACDAPDQKFAAVCSTHQTCMKGADNAPNVCAKIISDEEHCDVPSPQKCLCKASAETLSKNLVATSLWVEHDTICTLLGNELTQVNEYIEPKMKCADGHKKCVCEPKDHNLLSVVCGGGQICAEDDKQLKCFPDVNNVGKTASSSMMCRVDTLHVSICTAGQMCVSFDGNPLCIATILADQQPCKDKNKCLCHRPERLENSAVCEEKDVCRFSSNGHNYCVTPTTPVKKMGQFHEGVFVCTNEGATNGPAKTVVCSGKFYCQVKNGEPVCKDADKFLLNRKFCYEDDCLCAWQNNRELGSALCTKEQQCSGFPKAPTCLGVPIQSGTQCKNPQGCYCNYKRQDYWSGEESVFCKETQFCTVAFFKPTCVSAVVKDKNPLEVKKGEPQICAIRKSADSPPIFIECPSLFRCDLSAEGEPLCLSPTEITEMVPGMTCTNPEHGCMCLFNNKQAKCRASELCKEVSGEPKCNVQNYKYFECPKNVPTYCGATKRAITKTEYCEAGSIRNVYVDQVTNWNTVFTYRDLLILANEYSEQDKFKLYEDPKKKHLLRGLRQTKTKI